MAVLAGDAAARRPHRQALGRRRQRGRGRHRRPRERAWRSRSRPGSPVGATRTRQPRVRGGGSVPLPASARTQCALLQQVSQFRVPCSSPYLVEPRSFAVGCRRPPSVGLALDPRDQSNECPPCARQSAKGVAPTSHSLAQARFTSGRERTAFPPGHVGSKRRPSGARCGARHGDALGFGIRRYPRGGRRPFGRSTDPSSTCDRQRRSRGARLGSGST